MLTVSISGVDGVQQTLARIVPKSERAVLELAERIHELTVAGAEKHRKSSPSPLVDSFGNGPLKIPGGWKIEANKQRAPYAVFVHWGTPPHVIKPKTKKVLRWAGGGGWIFAKFVNHPGYKGDPFMVNAAKQALREFPNMIEQSMKGR